MNRTLSLVSIAVLALILLVLEVYGLRLYLFWTFWWFDILMHALGGLLIGATTLWFLTFEYPVSRVHSLWWSVAAVFVIGVAWEIFEYVTGISLVQAHGSYLIDTVSDIAMDIAGGLAAYLVFSKAPNG